MSELQAASVPAVDGERVPAAPLHLLLDIRADEAARLRAAIAELIPSARRPVTRRLRQVFWDAADHTIGRAGFALGIQTAGQRRQQIIRDLRALPAGGRLGTERTSPLDGDTLDVTRLAFMPDVGRSLIARLGAAMLVPSFAIDVTRTVWRGTFDSTGLTVTLERSEIEAAAGGEHLVQLDIALAEGHAEGVYRFARRLLAVIPFRLAEADAAQRAAALVDDAAPAPAEPRLSADMTVREGFLAIGRAGAAAVRRSVRALETDLGPEPIHQARVALRRLRSVLSVFRQVLPPLSARQFGRSLGGFAKLLGEAREWDVWLSQTVAPLLGALGGSDAVLEELTRAAAAARNRAAARIACSASGRDFVVLSLGLGAWFDAGIWPDRETEAEQALLDSNLPGFARELLRKRHRKLVKAAEGFDAASPERLHALRIEAKKLRYAAEFLAPLFPARATRRYLGALKPLQDILGAANDAVVARGLVPHLADCDATAAARAAGLVTGWTAAEAASARRRFAAAWDSFLDAKRFWKD